MAQSVNDKPSTPADSPSQTGRQALWYRGTPRRHAQGLPGRSLGQRIFNVVRNLAWVIPLTVLIWVFAEREERPQTPERLNNITIHLKADRPDRYVTFANGSPEERIQLDISGPSIGIRSAKSELERMGNSIEISIPTDSPASTKGQIAFAIQDAIAKSSVFDSRGLEVKSSPDSVLLNVDELTTIEVHPKSPADMANRFEAVVFDPPVVKLTGPKSRLSNPEVTAQIIEPMLLKGSDAQDIHAIPVTLADPSLRNVVQISPATVNAHVRLRSAMTSYKINTIPIYIMAPPVFLDQYRVTLPLRFMSNVTVVGPEDQINLIKSGEFTPKAWLELSRPEDYLRPLPKVPTYSLPKDVVVSEDDKSRTADYKVTERSRAE